MKNKAEELIHKTEVLREDMLNYVKHYVLTGLKGRNLEEDWLIFVWYDENSEPQSIAQAHSVDENGNLFVSFDYDGEKEPEQVEVERLSFEALGLLVCFFHDFIE